MYLLRHILKSKTSPENKTLTNWQINFQTSIVILEHPSYTGFSIHRLEAYFALWYLQEIIELAKYHSMKKLSYRSNNQLRNLVTLCLPFPKLKTSTEAS